MSRIEQNDERCQNGFDILRAGIEIAIDTAADARQRAREIDELVKLVAGSQR